MLLPNTPHSQSSEELYHLLKSSVFGIDPSQAKQRLSHYGHNTLKEEKRSLFTNK